jgi:hypothetical protein
MNVHCVCGQKMTMTELATRHAPRCPTFIVWWQQNQKKKDAKSTSKDRT